MSNLFFLLIGAISLAAALGVVLSRQPVHSALFLLANFASLAVLYVLLDAQFLAAAQVIIYAGGIVILILFVVMLIGHGSEAQPAGQRRVARVTSVLLGLILLIGLAAQVLTRQPAAEGIASGGSPSDIGAHLFTHHLLPFELVAILLLVALIGALVMGRKLKPNLTAEEGES